ncbi:hypothetical protein K502DRAFT_288371 [Neoconidiobolus thromboides FSU 785]|nr:hypothetical protein K502DRAFT_288371 [Neoconidiobolus thromboides FSU 785]
MENIVSVKPSDFKKCKDSAFCQRNKKHAEYKKEHPKDIFYKVIKDTIQFENSEFQANILNIKDNVELVLQVSILEHLVTRVKVFEKDGIHKRYDQVKEHALVGEPKLISSKKLKETKKDNLFTIQSEDFKVSIQNEPFKLDFYLKKENVVTFNERDLFRFEHYRKREEVKQKAIESETVSDGEKKIAVEEKEEEGLWEETFNGHTDVKKHGPSSIGFDVTFHEFEHVYGIPQHASNLSLKSTDGTENQYSEPYRLYNLDVFEYEIDNPMALYGSIPFMVAHNKKHSAGLFWLNAAEMWIDVEKQEVKKHTKVNNFNLLTLMTISSHTHWISESGLLDVFVFVEKDTKQVLKRYGELTGFTALPTTFALAYHQCRWNYINEKDVLEVNDNFDKYDIPYDVIWLDIEHTQGKKYFTWDQDKFPNPESMQDQIAASGRKMVAIVDPHIKREDDYYVYKEATDLGYFVKNPSGADFDGWCWPGSSSWVDYTRKEACDWWSKKFQLDEYKHSTKNLYVWNDMNEPSVFNGPEITMQKNLLHYNEVEHRDVHNMFGMLFHRSTSHGIVKRTTPNQRPFVLSRAFFAGTQRFGAIWTGDNGATWEYLGVSTPMLLTIGLSGIPFSGADVGGFFGNPDPELLVRWYQTGAFQPFFRAHAHIDTKRREPWVLGEPYTSQIRTAIRSRYQLLPYWYTLLFEASINGTPAMRPMFLEFPKDESVFGMDDQYMVGSGLLVKPITKPGVTEIDIYLPGDEDWYNYYNYKNIKSGKHVIKTEVDSIPVFIRSGEIITQKSRIRRSSTLMLKDPITLLVTVDNDGKAKGKLYFDDGMSYDYLRKGYAYREFKLKDNKLTNHAVDNKTYSIFFKGVRVEKIVFLNIKKSPKKVVCLKCGREVEFNFNKQEKILTVKDPKLMVAEDWSLGLDY